MLLTLQAYCPAGRSQQTARGSRPGTHARPGLRHRDLDDHEQPLTSGERGRFTEHSRDVSAKGALTFDAPATSAVNHVKASNRFNPIGTLAALIVSTMLTVPPPAAAQANATRADRKAFVRPGYAVAYPPYLYPGACLYGTCGGIWWADRRPMRRPVAPAAAEPAEQDIWGTTGSPWGYVRRLPPPTPDSRIQPLYRDASTIRPEFSERDGTAPDEPADTRYSTITAVPAFPL